jgi:tRNA threonylcarbamoyladenosine biosynthesis protein TsaE
MVKPNRRRVLEGPAMILPAEGDFRLEDEAATGRLGAAVGQALAIGEAVCLWGPLGAGKTTLARGLIRALAGPAEDVPSPTFTLVQFYPTDRLRLAHFDLYRIARADEAHEIGLDEALDDGAALIEWPERLEGHLPPDRLDIELAVVGRGADEQRLARLIPHGAWEGRPIEF